MVRLFSVLAAHHDEEADIAKPCIDSNFGTIVTDPRYVSRELPGVSIFCKNEAGEVFHTYSTYARGLDMLLGARHSS
jgi:predicted dithiol-disulfide oxidoreductase (DUF899 family)